MTEEMTQEITQELREKCLPEMNQQNKKKETRTSRELHLLFEQVRSLVATKYKILEIEGTGYNGSFNLKTHVISVKSDMEEIHKIRTLLHEVAHCIDFELYPGMELSRNRRELVAESVAFVVIRRLGLDTSSYSIQYIESWMQGDMNMEEIAEIVREVSERIIRRFEQSMEL